MAARRGGIPFRADLDPADIPRLLPHLFIVERIRSTGRFFFRLSGTGIREIMGFENTNHFLDELLHGEDLEAVSAMFAEVMEQGACIRSIEGLTYDDRSYRRVEILRLPLRAADGEARLVLGCLSRIEDEDTPGSARGTVKNRQVIHIHNDVEPRSTFQAPGQSAGQ
ncbi:MAG: PAS domain-containing protein [Bacteroidota bacterium]|nr:PAS domain-containing protein [Kiloniellaceae bacterium]